MSSRPGSNRPTMQKKKPGLSKRLMRKLQSGELGRICRPKNWKGHPKVGRNEPCPCGSGKKYKHCCLKKVK